MFWVVVDLGKERSTQITQRVACLTVHHIEIDWNKIRFHLFLGVTEYLNDIGNAGNCEILVNGFCTGCVLFLLK